MLIIPFGVFAAILLGTIVSIDGGRYGYTRLPDTKIRPGAFYETSRGWHVFGLDENNVMVGSKECPTTTITTIVAIHKYSSFAKGVLVKEEKIDNSKGYNNFDPAVGAALAKRLVGKAVPYNRINCNKYTYRRYFLYGKAVWDTTCFKCAHGGLAKGCPLARELHGLTVKGVQDPDFFLLDADDNVYRISDFPPFRNYDREYADYKDPSAGSTMTLKE